MQSQQQQQQQQQQRRRQQHPSQPAEAADDEPWPGTAAAATHRVSTAGWLPTGGLNGSASTTATVDTAATPGGWPTNAMSDASRPDPIGAAASTPRRTTPSLRFLPFVEQTPRGHPPLVFNPIYRTLPNNDHIIRIGRYSERDNTADQNSPAAQRGGSVGFKSKVVSRRHCEMFQSCGQWYIKDVKSSSGTFLNHIRLSPPGAESRAYPVHDGDHVQLGIDFRGGEEMIFRCVKIRLELNKGWQRSLNNFNTAAHKRLQEFQKQNRLTDDNGSTTSTECSICLNAVATLFVAPCSHTWHFKCIKTVIDDNYPNFLCPNCRGLADLEADVDEPFAEEWQEDEDEPLPSLNTAGTAHDQGDLSSSMHSDASGAASQGSDSEALVVQLPSRGGGGAAAGPPTPVINLSSTTPITAAVEARNRINQTNGQSSPRSLRDRRQDGVSGGQRDNLIHSFGGLTIAPNLPIDSMGSVAIPPAPASAPPASAAAAKTRSGSRNRMLSSDRSTPVSRAFAGSITDSNHEAGAGSGSLRGSSSVAGAAPRVNLTEPPPASPRSRAFSPQQQQQRRQQQRWPSPARSGLTVDTPSTAVPVTAADGLGSDERALRDLTDAGPMTPRNDLGPFVLDGGAGRTELRRPGNEVNLDAVVGTGTVAGGGGGSTGPR